MAKPCPCTDCPRRIARHLVACRAHWYALPMELRLRIWQLYRTRRYSHEHLQALREANRILAGLS